MFGTCLVIHQTVQGYTPFLHLPLCKYASIFMLSVLLYQLLQLKKMRSSSWFPFKGKYLITRYTKGIICRYDYIPWSMIVKQYTSIKSNLLWSSYKTWRYTCAIRSWPNLSILVRIKGKHINRGTFNSEWFKTTWFGIFYCKDSFVISSSLFSM